jgi:hypothetical protein
VQAQVWCKSVINHSHPLDLNPTAAGFMKHLLCLEIDSRCGGIKCINPATVGRSLIDASG